MRIVGKKKEPWRIAAGVLSVAYIIFLWVKKDIAAVYSAMPQEQLAPLVAATVVVSLVKVCAIAGGILLVRWIISKANRK